MEIKLEGNRAYPIFRIGHENLFAALDSCAIFPVWTTGVETLYRAFDGIVKLDNCFTLLGGFGSTKVTRKEVYNVPRIVILDNKLELLNVPVAVGTISNSTSFSIVLPRIALFDAMVTSQTTNGRLCSLGCVPLSNDGIFRCEPNGTYVEKEDAFYMNRIAMERTGSNWDKWLRYKNFIKENTCIDEEKICKIRSALRAGTRAF